HRTVNFLNTDWLLKGDQSGRDPYPSVKPILISRKHIRNSLKERQQVPPSQKPIRLPLARPYIGFNCSFALPPLEVDIAPAQFARYCRAAYPCTCFHGLTLTHLYGCQVRIYGK